MIKDWCYRFLKYPHSLSITLGIGAITTFYLSWYVEYGTWIADFWFTVSGGFFGSWLLVVFAKFLWEKDSDPTKPPPIVIEEDCNDE